ncbi:MAG TPA: hypothetical protein PLG55_08455 [Methanospirillum sp.]|uniref:hypothetical protein n=1 Tax=Methanospirillum sp. TaxID=45200 RepID=UPI002B682760|nr:hypothetical protein [Methanospirillum sp.]HPY60738.1 hypothetical protein [Methanospirillum sp.]
MDITMKRSAQQGVCCLILSVLILMTSFSIAQGSLSEEQIIFNGPFFENFGQGFSNWTGDTAPPGGTLLLKGSLTAMPDEVAPGDDVEFTLKLDVSAMTISGKDGAVLKNTRDRNWTLDTVKLLGNVVDFPVIPDAELLGIGVGSQVPGLILRSTKRMVTVHIPDTVQPGNYSIRAFIAGTDMRTGSVSITVLDRTPAIGEEILPTPTDTLTPEPTPFQPEEEEQISDPGFTGTSAKIINEREIHVTSIYPYSGGAGNTMGIKIYGDHFSSPVYVTLVKDDFAIDAYNYCFIENQKYGVAMIDIPGDVEKGMWNLVITTKTGKAWVPFEITDKQIAPVIISVDAPVLTPDKVSDVTISGRDLMGPCEILLAGDGLSWFSFYPKPVLTHNTMKIRVKIDVPLSDEVKSGKLDLCVINSDGVTAVYKKAISFTLEQ